MKEEKSSTNCPAKDTRIKNSSQVKNVSDNTAFEGEDSNSDVCYSKRKIVHLECENQKGSKSKYDLSVDDSSEQTRKTKSKEELEKKKKKSYKENNFKRRDKKGEDERKKSWHLNKFSTSNAIPTFSYPSSSNHSKFYYRLEEGEYQYPNSRYIRSYDPNLYYPHLNLGWNPIEMLHLQRNFMPYSPSRPFINYPFDIYPEHQNFNYRPAYYPYDFVSYHEHLHRHPRHYPNDSSQESPNSSTSSSNANQFPSAPDDHTMNNVLTYLNGWETDECLELIQSLQDDWRKIQKEQISQFFEIKEKEQELLKQELEEFIYDELLENLKKNKEILKK